MVSPSNGKKFCQDMTRYGRYFDFTDKNLESNYCRIYHCYKILWDLEPTIFIYPSCSIDDKKEIKKANKQFLDQISKIRGSVYTINSRKNHKYAWVKKYIGSSNDMRARIRQHLIKRPKGTESCFELVEKAVRDGHEIAISWIKITPDFLRVGIEHIIIGLEKTTDKNALPWNGCPGKRPGNET